MIQHKDKGLKYAVKKPIIVLSMILFLSFASGSLTAQTNKAPGFALEDQNGNTISLDDFEGSWIHLDFSADWCYWCHYQAEYMEEAEDLIAEMGVENFVSITLLSQDETGGPPSPAVLRKWENLYGIVYVLADPNGTVTNQYPIEGFPTNVILSPDLEILEYWSGAYQTGEDFVAALESMVPEMFN
jgi:peroxiredoxin